MLAPPSIKSDLCTHYGHSTHVIALCYYLYVPFGIIYCDPILYHCRSHQWWSTCDARGVMKTIRRTTKSTTCNRLEAELYNAPKHYPLLQLGVLPNLSFIRNYHQQPPSRSNWSKIRVVGGGWWGPALACVTFRPIFRAWFMLFRPVARMRNPNLSWWLMTWWAQL